MKNKGITLISLIVTIIVLLILAGVSISVLFGENGILNEANNAKEKSQIKNYEEKIRLAVTEANSDAYTNPEKYKTKASILDKVTTILEGDVEFKDAQITKSYENADNPKLIIITKEGYVFYAYTDKTTYEGKMGVDIKEGDLKLDIEIKTGDIAYELTPNEWTQEKVEVEIYIANEEYQQYAIQYSYNGTTWNNYTERLIVEENVDIYTRLTNGIAVTANSTIAVRSIDKTAPTINTQLSHVVESGEVTFSVTTTDTISGLSKIVWYYKVDDESTYKSVEEVYKDVNGTQPGETFQVTKSKKIIGIKSGICTAYAEIYDMAGNKAKTQTISFELDNTGTETQLTNWNYALDDANNTITLNYYTLNWANVEREIMVYNKYNVNGKTYSTKLASNGSSDWRYMFKEVSAVESIVFDKNIDTNDVTNMSYMFSGCHELTSIDLSELDISNVTDMSYLFDGCNRLTSIDLSRVDTSNVTNVSNMFNQCTELKSINLSGLNLSNITDISNIFSSCNSLTNLDLSGVNLSSVTNMSRIFWGNNRLTNLDLSGLDVSGATDMSYMFEGCNQLTNINLNGLIAGKSMSYMFSGWHELTSIDLSELDISNVTDMSYMFSGCNALTSIDLSGVDTSNVTNVSYMFRGCNQLRSINLSELNLSSITDISNIFSDCNSLTNINLSRVDLSGVENTSSMFFGKAELTNIDLSEADLSNVTDMSKMFENCTQLKTVDLSGVNISSETNVSGMFVFCPQLTTVYVTEGKWEADTTNMFVNCYQINSVTYK